MSYDIKQVIIIRKDLNMRKGKIAAQCCHASMKVLLDRMKRERGVIIPEDEDDVMIPIIKRSLKLEEAGFINQWLEGSFAKIVVSCDSWEELMSIQLKANEAKIPAALITDAGVTEFNGVPTVTCLAIGPHSSEEINKITGNLKLL